MMEGGLQLQPAFRRTEKDVVSDRSLEDALPAAQAGQAWALRAVYDALAPRVLGYLTSRGASEPEDLTSEVFLSVFSKLPAVTGGVAGLRTLTFSIAHARLVDDLRRRSRREPVVPYDDQLDARVTPSAEDTALVAWERERVQRLLDHVGGEQRDVLVLRILGDLTVEQVAEVLGKSPGAVKQLQRRGLLALRRALDSQPDASGVPL